MNFFSTLCSALLARAGDKWKLLVLPILWNRPSFKEATETQMSGTEKATAEIRDNQFIQCLLFMAKKKKKKDNMYM